MLEASLQRKIERAAQIIRDADAVVVAAGAGMGVDSGLPDFRGKDGFWEAYPALAAAGIEFKRAASEASFKRDVSRAWGFYGHRLALYRRTVPHAGFRMLQKWASGTVHGYSVFTSNVDGQFQRAGFDADSVHECHGSIHYLQCTRPCSETVWPADQFIPEVDEINCRLLGEPPSCPTCGALARPNILMFDDWCWVDLGEAAQAAVQKRWLEQVERPVVIEVGAGSAIPSVRNFSRRVAQLHGATIVRINLREPGVERKQDVGLSMSALEALQAIDSALQL